MARLLARQVNIRMPAAVAKIPAYVDDLVLQAVPRKPGINCVVDHCWFNCRDYVSANPGAEMVFGWNLFAMSDGVGNFGFGAVHHTVICDANGMFDITPRADANDDAISMFLPDSRVPYDYENFRSPFPFFFDITARPLVAFWTSDLGEPFANRLATYSIARADASSEGQSE